MSLNIHVYGTSLGHVVKRASGEIYNVSATSFITIHIIIMATNVTFCLSRDL